MKMVRCSKCGELSTIHLRRSDRPPDLKNGWNCHICGGQLEYTGVSFGETKKLVEQFMGENNGEEESKS